MTWICWDVRWLGMRIFAVQNWHRHLGQMNGGLSMGKQEVVVDNTDNIDRIYYTVQTAHALMGLKSLIFIFDCKASFYIFLQFLIESAL